MQIIPGCARRPWSALTKNPSATRGRSSTTEPPYHTPNDRQRPMFRSFATFWCLAVRSNRNFDRITGLLAPWTGPRPVRAALRVSPNFFPQQAAPIPSGATMTTDLPARGGAMFSQLSPWLHAGLLSEAEVLESVLAHHSPRAAEKFVAEVFLADLFQGLSRTTAFGLGKLLRKPGLGAGRACGECRETQQLTPRRTEGKTGIQAFDTWTRELVTTGYLHNHARMWFASIWIFTPNGLTGTWARISFCGQPDGWRCCLEHAIVALGSRGCTQRASTILRGPITLPATPVNASPARSAPKGWPRMPSRCRSRSNTPRRLPDLPARLAPRDLTQPFRPATARRGGGITGRLHCPRGPYW